MTSIGFLPSICFALAYNYSARDIDEPPNPPDAAGGYGGAWGGPRGADVGGAVYAIGAD